MAGSLEEVVLGVYAQKECLPLPREDAWLTCTGLLRPSSPTGVFVPSTDASLGIFRPSTGD